MKKILVVIVILLIVYIYSCAINYYKLYQLEDYGFSVYGAGFYTYLDDDSYAALSSPYIPRVFSINFNSLSEYQSPFDPDKESPLKGLWVGRESIFSNISYSLLTTQGSCDTNSQFTELKDDNIYCLEYFSDLSPFEEQINDYKGSYPNNNFYKFK